MENLKAKKKIEPHKFLRKVYFEASDMFAELIRYCVAEELNFREEMDKGIITFASWISDKEIKKLVLKQKISERSKENLWKKKWAG